MWEQEIRQTWRCYCGSTAADLLSLPLRSLEMERGSEGRTGAATCRLVAQSLPAKSELRIRLVAPSVWSNVLLYVSVSVWLA